jgi:hypothetical protein
MARLSVCQDARNIAAGRRRVEAPRSLFLDHHFRGFDHDRYIVTGLQVEILGAPARDDAVDFAVANLNDHVGHYSTEIYFFHFAFELVARGKRHTVTL